MLQRHDYPEHACDCKSCVEMCTRFPCRPMPDEVEAMPAEVRARLCLNYFNGHDGDVEYLQAAPEHYEGGHFPEFIGIFGMLLVPQRCTFLEPNGKCELHGTCKPWEGRIANHNMTGYPEGHTETKHDLGFRLRDAELLFEAWDTDKGRAVVESWKNEVQQ